MTTPRSGEPAIEIRTDAEGANPVALVGERPLERGRWRIAEGAEEIRDDRVQEIVGLARQLVEKVAALRGSQAMGRVEIQTRNDAQLNVPGAPLIRIQSQWPIDKKE